MKTMQRQRGELVPIGEVIDDLDGPVKAIRDASPQALHHFTRFDQAPPFRASQRSVSGLSASVWSWLKRNG